MQPSLMWYGKSVLVTVMISLKFSSCLLKVIPSFKRTDSNTNKLFIPFTHVSRFFAIKFSNFKIRIKC